MRSAVLTLLVVVVVVAGLGILPDTIQSAYPGYRALLPLVAKAGQEPWPTQAPPPTATNTPTATATSTAVPCNGSLQVLANTSFETGLYPWMLNESVLRTNSTASDGTWSALVAGYNNSQSGIGQAGPVPLWAESATLYFDELMASTDSTLVLHDALAAVVYDSATTTTLADGWIWNTGQRNAWLRWRLPVSNIANWRGRTIGVMLVGFTDAAFPTGWYLDNVRFYFACGSTIANVDTEALTLESNAGRYKLQDVLGLWPSPRKLWLERS